MEIFIKITYDRPQRSVASVKSFNSVEDVWVHPGSEMRWVRQEWHIGS